MGVPRCEGPHPAHYLGKNTIGVSVKLWSTLFQKWPQIFV